MTRVGTPVAVAFTVAGFLAALSTVAWRQGRAREVIEERELLRSEIALALDEGSELRSEIERLQSRRRVVRDAETRLGMRLPRDHEVVNLPVGDR